MESSRVQEIMKGIKNGTFGVVEYETEIPVNKEAKKSGIKIYCKTKKMVRFGADYKNLVKDISSAEVKPRTNNYTWVIPNKVAYNSKTEKEYVRVSNVNRKTISRKYSVIYPEAVRSIDTLESVTQFLQPSYFKDGNYSKPIVQNISIANIISINGIGD